MKILKTGFLTLVLLVFSFSIIQAQDTQPTMFAVHTDNVHFSMAPQYEQVMKELLDNFTKYNIQDVSWTSISVEDGRYVHVGPINSMADLDKNPMGTLFENMGTEAATQLFNKMDECYDSHTDNVVHYIPELSFNPESAESIEDKNHREYHFLYYAPKNEAAITEAMKAVKALFEAKGIKNGYSIYKSGFGSPESYYMVSVAAKDGVEMAQTGKANNEAFGEEGDATFFNVIKLTTRYDQVEGTIRPDLSYTPKQ
ncbi:hypothetical protein D7030_03415 [Flavobacteriaceae bacterium AU392]|nr:hypothetical protein D1817_09890 [Flavobacteriaceae bacterium]RKM85728.1 hypothetical protein D7030_03415 [Flavobacteriaceae bacterium AU392]